MIRKEISDYVSEVTRETNEHYKSLGLDIVFTEKEVKRILTMMLNNLYTALLKNKDVHISGFFRLCYSKRQRAYYDSYKAGPKYNPGKKQFYHIDKPYLEVLRQEAQKHRERRILEKIANEKELSVQKELQE